MSTLGERLKRVRVDAGMSQEAFGAELGEQAVQYQTVLKYEKDETVPSADFISAVCRTYDVNPTWLLVEEGPMRWSEARDAEWWGGATYVSRRILKELGEIISRERLRELRALLEDNGDGVG